MITLICKTCGKEFEVKNYRKNTAKYCSYKCYDKTGFKHSEKTKRKIRKARLGKKLSEITIEKIRQAQLRENGNNWKGGKTKSENRWYILKPEHPFARNNRYVLRSRLVAEKYLKRYLTPIEIIHHINEIPDDDRPENLYLFETNSKHISYHNLKNKPKLKSNL